MAAREMDFQLVRPGNLSAISLNDERVTSFKRLYPQASAGEALLHWWLTTVAKMVRGQDFYYQAPTSFGTKATGSYVLDFLVIKDQGRPLDIEVQSVAYHTDFVHGDPVGIQVYDKVRRQVLEDNGIHVVWVLDNRLYEALDDTMHRVLAGQDVMV